MPDDLAYRWCRRIFASVDVAGSTAFKQRSPEDSGRWAYIFKLFFDEFPTTLRACFEKLSSFADGKPSAPMSVWKFVGDEILFSAEIGRHEAVAYHVVAFRDAINEYSEQLRKKSELSALSLKGTIWGAGFPVTNAEVTTKLADGQGSLKDFLGPCVDQGFRLCALADPRRIPISVDIAYMLATTTFSSTSPIKLQCEEPKPHKGVPFAYPHIWIDRRNGKETAEDKLLGRRPLLDPGGIKDYLEELFAESRPGMFKPFLVEDPSGLFKNVPEAMNATRDKLLRAAAERTYTEDELAVTAMPGTRPPVPTLPSHSVKAKKAKRKKKNVASKRSGR